MPNDAPELNDVAEVSYFWIRLITTALALVVMLVGRRPIAIHLSAFRLAMRRIDEVDVDDGEFVRRPKNQQEILASLENKRHETVFVYGPRGSGKTSLVNHALKNRRGVFEIKIFKKTLDEATAEFIEGVSKGLDIFRSSQDLDFVHDVFAACWVSPIVVVSLEHRCNGEVLEAVLTLCKNISYERRRSHTARFVVVLSGSRTAIDSSIQLEDLRCIGVHVANFSDSEALLYVTERVPKSFKDHLRRNQIARRVVNAFDGRVLTLQKVCDNLRKGRPADLDDVNARIEKEREREETRAGIGWSEFCKLLANALDTEYDAAAVKQMAVKLLKGPQRAVEIVTLLSRKSEKVPLSPRDIGLFNADAGHHPLTIDPFETTLSLSGKAIAAVLRKKYN